jgi:hypothetical protein
MVRKTRYLRKDQMRDVEIIAKQQRKSRSQVIRELIELGRKQPVHRARAA